MIPDTVRDAAREAAQLALALPWPRSLNYEARIAADAAAQTAYAAQTARIEALTAAGDALADAVEAIGENRRYWPRDMHLDGTDAPVEAALTAWRAATGQETP